MRQRLNGLTVLTIAGVITYYSIRPVPTGPYEPSGFSYMPYVYHVVAYVVLAAALLLYFHDTRKGHIEAVMAAAVFGAVIETVQYGLPSRYFSIADMTVNLAGAALVMLDHRSVVVTQVIQTEDRLLEQTLR